MAFDNLSLMERVARAIIHGERRSGLDPTMGDVIAPATDDEFFVAAQAAKIALGDLHEAALELSKLHPNTTQASPVVAAIMAMLPAHNLDADYTTAEGAMSAILAIADLPLGPYVEANLESRRGNSPSKDYKVRAAVRAAMHHLSLEGLSFRGGWKRRARDPKLSASRASDSDLLVTGAAKTIVEAVRSAGLNADHAALKGHYDDYIKDLAGRSPAESDYISEFQIDDHQEQV